MLLYAEIGNLHAITLQLRRNCKSVWLSLCYNKPPNYHSRKRILIYIRASSMCIWSCYLHTMNNTTKGLAFSFVGRNIHNDYYYYYCKRHILAFGLIGPISLEKKRNLWHHHLWIYIHAHRSSFDLASITSIFIEMIMIIIRILHKILFNSEK